MKNIIIGQSGGPTAVINSSLAGAIEYALQSDEVGKVYGMVNGIEGLMQDQIIDLGEMFRPFPHELNRLKHSPAMFLGSCRYKITGKDEEYERIFEFLKAYDIAWFIYIGGNDSMDTVQKLSLQAVKRGADVKFVGIPKTIDNDLNGIDHSPGFGSAAKYIASCVREVAYDTSIYSIKAVHIIETMGRDAGWLTAASVLARQDVGRDARAGGRVPDVDELQRQHAGCLQNVGVDGDGAVVAETAFGHPEAVELACD